MNQCLFESYSCMWTNNYLFTWDCAPRVTYSWIFSLLLQRLQNILQSLLSCLPNKDSLIFFPKTELAVLIRHKTHFTLRALSCQIIEDIFYPRMKAPMIQLPLSDRPLLFSGLQYRCEYYFMYRSRVHYLKSWQISKEKECGLMKIQKLEENVGSSLLSFGGRWLWLSNGSCTILMIMQR